MVMQTEHNLLIFSLGPVQSFIGAARRTQDLWLSSQLLSNLATVGVEKANNLGTVVYPVQTDNRWPESVPNRFVVSTPPDKGEQVAQAITEVVETAWQMTARKVESYFEDLAPESGWQAIWSRQVDDWLEIYWIVWSQDGSYADAYQQASLALDARKQMRHISPVAEPGETCSLCGLRQALHGGRNSHRGVGQFWAAVREHSQVTGAELRANEQLCAVCTTKRFAARADAYIGRRLLKPADRFPSTSSVAVAAFKGQLLEEWDQVGEEVLAHLDAIDQWAPGAPYARPEQSNYLAKRAEGKEGAERLLRYDGDFFYPESFADDHLAELLNRAPTAQDRSQGKRALATLTALLHAAKQINIPHPPTYLTVLHMDGDRMGRSLGQSRSIQEHQTVSDALARFAEEEVPTIVQADYAGRIVYAGGDDVLAFLPVEHALPAANRLRQAFADKMERTGLAEMTASAGLAFGHRTYPLGSTLEAARRAERQAKEELGRNALAVEVIRRSGEWDRIGTKWSYPGSENDTISILYAVYRAINGNLLSGKFALDVETESTSLVSVPAAHEEELGRLLTRHWQGQPRTEYLPVIAAMAQELATICQHSRIGMEPFAKWLLLMRFLSQGGRE